MINVVEEFRQIDVNYTLDELFIDKEKYPERYQQLCDEIQRRKDRGGFEPKLKEIEAREDVDDWPNELIIEFSSQGREINRKLFILGFILINVVLLAFALPKYIVSDLSSVHEYSTVIDFVECHKDEVVDDETDKVSAYFDLNIGSYQDIFSAVDIGTQKCKNLARDLNVGTTVSIWHDGGLIYQLKSDNGILLPYIYMKPKIRDLQTNDAMLYWFGVVALWFLLFKSVANAVVPGTFAHNKRE